MEIIEAIPFNVFVYTYSTLTLIFSGEETACALNSFTFLLVIRF